MLHAIIMAGGSGTRFWPASRGDRPKQLLDLTGDETMIQATVSRLGDLVPNDHVLIVTNQRLVDPIREQLPDLPPTAVLGEPCKRDTAPCIGLAAGWVMRNDPAATMVVMPADHVIGPDDVFRKTISFAASLVEETPDRLVTFGIRPSHPSESFGYVERGSQLSTGQGTVYQVKQFREKPQADVAREYLEAGTFYWNSGIFVWKAKTIVDQLARHEPEMYAHIEAILEKVDTPDFEETFQSEFAAIKGKSIDYAVMERAKDVCVVEAPFEWDDLGSWQALARLRGADTDGNTLVGKTLCLDTSGSIIRSDGDHLIATVGLEDCIVVHTSNATLVAQRSHEESIRKVVKTLEERGWSDFL